MSEKIERSLREHQQHLEVLPLSALFKQDPDRFKKFSVELKAGLLFDFSKQWITESILKELCALAENRGLSQFREALFSGEKINASEQRAALHTALRDPSPSPIYVDTKDIKPEIQRVLTEMAVFRQKLVTGEILSATGMPFRDVLCLGIGGSALGPTLVVDALKPYQTKDFNLHFISNVDGYSLESCLQRLNPNTTLCVISSKTFTTSETLTNAKAVKAWFQKYLGADNPKIQSHWVAVTAAKDKALAWGVPTQQIFEFWDWVGGRYSIWSAVGLPVVLALGMPIFKALLTGAHTIDQHFLNEPLEKNIPVLMGLLSYWNTCHLGHTTLAVIPYANGLEKLPAYLQQLEMESNGKSVGRNHKKLSYKTAPILWGGIGCDGQHSYMQLLHQGTEVVPVDFLVGKESQGDWEEHQQILIANCLAQSQALMQGTEHLVGATDPLEVMRYCSGNRPSSTFIYQKLTPEILGSLLALYEHKVFVQSVLLSINPFDQWGVELGKKLAATLLPALQHKLPSNDLDSSTQGLLEFINRENPQT